MAKDSRPCGIALKFYSCVGSNHTTLDAIRDIRKRRPFTLDEIDEIVVHGSQVTVDHVGWPYKPEGLTAAQLNLPFCVATLLLEGDVFVDSSRRTASTTRPHRAVAQGQGGARSGDHRARRGASATRCASTCIFATARSRRETREAPRGSEQSFASADDIVDKFRKLTRGVMADKQQDALIEAVLTLESLPDSKRLAELMQL